MFFIFLLFCATLPDLLPFKNPHCTYKGDNIVTFGKHREKAGQKKAFSLGQKRAEYCILMGM
jgi:hypothetical protein